jgi:general secretion pathway protein H
MTFAEIMVVIAIVGLIAMATAAAIGGIFEARLVSSCNRLSGMIRYAYNLASLHGKVHRVTIDIEGGTYALEEVEEKDECSEELLAAEEEADEKKEGEEEALAGTKIEDNRVRTQKLPGGIRFTGLLTRHNKKVVEEGTEAVYFFPDGTAEKAFIWLTDGGDVFTVEVTSLRGTGMVWDEELEAKELEKR